ncbi:hypothetical protein PQQ51_06005 [Paraburkholderia xenovorans]|uniref:hypothetical protein n=1 Tax=Paraburkholderia xenovorans TaxID=36873 RepID=UPI0038BA1F80
MVDLMAGLADMILVFSVDEIYGDAAILVPESCTPISDIGNDGRNLRVGQRKINTVINGYVRRRAKISPKSEFVFLAVQKK